MAQITQILLFSWMWLLERSKITVWERNLVKKKFNYGSFVVMSTLRKKVFSGAPFKYFFLYGSSNSNSVVFGNTSLAEMKDHSLRVTPFQPKKYCYGSFGFASTLCIKLFSGPPAKCFSLHDSNNSDSVVFVNSTFWEVKDHILSPIEFLQIF